MCTGWWILWTTTTTTTTTTTACCFSKGFSKDCCGHKVNHCSSHPDLVAWGELRMEKNRLLAMKPSATWMVNSKGNSGWRRTGDWPYIAKMLFKGTASRNPDSWIFHIHKLAWDVWILWLTAVLSCLTSFFFPCRKDSYISWLLPYLLGRVFQSYLKDSSPWL